MKEFKEFVTTLSEEDLDRLGNDAYERSMKAAQEKHGPLNQWAQVQVPAKEIAKQTTLHLLKKYHEWLHE